MPGGRVRGRPAACGVALGVPGPGRPDHRPCHRGPRLVRRLAWLAAAVVFYSIAAWSVAPGFYDGFGPPQPYNFTCPPPQAGANTKPSSGHLDIKIINGVSDANSAFTDDGQIVIGFLPGAFDVTGKTGVSVDITPLETCPKPPGLGPERSVDEPGPVGPGAALHRQHEGQDARLFRRRLSLDLAPAGLDQGRGRADAADRGRGVDRRGRAGRPAARHRASAPRTG